VRGRLVLLAVGTTVCAGVPPADAARLSVKGAKAETMRICGASQRVYVVPTGRVVLRVRNAKRLRITTCRAGKWKAVRSVRVKKRRATRVRLPRLAPGAYRIVVPRVGRIVVRVQRAATGDGGRLLPLLDRAPVRAPMVAFCDGADGRSPKPDTTPLPPDPRLLVNDNLKREDLATYFNASWLPVHDAPGMRPTPFRPPATCGEFRRDVREGREFLYGKQFFQLLASARAYDNIWRAWGLDARPKDFDQQVRDRYGLSVAPFRNPYPLEGEDPATTNGGSGQLPLGLVQGQDKDTGAYNGQVTITCAACHDSILGTPQNSLGFFPGRGNESFEAGVFGGDMVSAAGSIGEFPNPGALEIAAVPYPYSSGRGLTNSFGLLDFLAAGFDMESLNKRPGVEVFPLHGAAGQVQTPNWWNRSHRTRMFLSGELSGDNTRVSMALAVPQNQRTGPEVKKLEPKFEQVHVFLDSLSPPQFPKEVDTKLAEEGAVLFHEKNLWDDSRNRAIKQQPGNGSCASCHGVYSPRYAHDTKFLPDPRLKGIEANITPIETIGTDPARTRLVNEQFKRAWNTSWWGYDDLNPSWTPEGQGREGTTLERAMYDYGIGPPRLEGPNKWSNEPLGYEAPPLYGAWASAPYFHNGSVPTIRQVLQPGRRPAIWTRPRTKPGEGGIVQGVDQSLAAYDFDNLGHKWTEVKCDGQEGQTPVVPCRPHGSPLSVVEGELSKLLGPNLFVANQDLPEFSGDDRERRQIYNTNEYSLGNMGHEFTKVLDEHEVRAILEYLKTL
jgi:mono/diheme cytochrome c family protein